MAELPAHSPGSVGAVVRGNGGGGQGVNNGKEGERLGEHLGGAVGPQARCLCFFLEED